MTLAERAGDVIQIHSTYAERTVIRQLPGATHKGANIWHVPLTWAACVTLRGLFGASLEVGPELKSWAWDEYQGHIKPALDLRDAMELPPDSDTVSALDRIESDGSGLKLNSYQRADAAFLAVARHALLANPPGLGKSGSTIRAVQLLDQQGEMAFPVGIICPNSLKITVWKEEIAKWAPDWTVSVVDGTMQKRRKQLAEKAHAYVINWESVRLHSKLAGYGTVSLSPAEREAKELNKLGFGTVIMDEAHRLAHPSASKQCRAAWAVAHQAEFRFALTGTPVPDHVGDFWGLLHGIEPRSFPAKTRYLDRWAEITLNLWGGMEVVGLNPATAEEFRSITNPMWRRIPKAAALPFLPEKLPVQYRFTPMTTSQAKLYRQMEEEMLVQLEDGEILTASGQLPRLTRLMQFAAASVRVNDAGDVDLVNPSCKVNDLVELLEEMGDEPLVVAAVSRKLIELAAAKLKDIGISYGLVTGAQSVADRAQAVNAFQDGKIRVILLTIGAGSEGITLTRANTLCFMQRSFRPLENEQTEGRVDRIGAEIHDCIRIIEQITPGTVEERKRALLMGKEARIEEVVRDKDALRRLLGA